MSHPPSPPDDDYPTDLELAIYLYGPGNQRQRCDAALASGLFYNPRRPLVLYLHGWEPGTSERQFRESFDTSYSVKLTPGSITSDAWVRDGWNVGMFYWNQLSDEPILESAEAKIYTPQGPEGMRWRQKDGSFYPSFHNVTVAQLLVDRYVQCLKSFRGPEIRIVGHSLGSQLALEFYRLLVTHPRIRRAIIPQRIELLDPYCSPEEVSYLQKDDMHSACERMVGSARLAVGRGVALQTLQSSWIAEMASDLKPLTAWTRWRTDWLPVWDFRDQHLMAIGLYFLSYSLDHPFVIMENGNQSHQLRLGARATPADIRTVMAWTHHGLYQTDVTHQTTAEDGGLVFQKIHFNATPEELTMYQFMSFVKVSYGAIAGGMAYLLGVTGLTLHRYWNYKSSFSLVIPEASKA